MFTALNTILYAFLRVGQFHFNTERKGFTRWAKTFYSPHSTFALSIARKSVKDPYYHDLNMDMKVLAFQQYTSIQLRAS